MRRLYETSLEEFLTEDYLLGMEIILAVRLRSSLLLDEEQREDVGGKQGNGEKGEGRSCSQCSAHVPALQQNNYPSNYPKLSQQ